MKSTKKEKKQYKKAFQEAMARELREHKSSFIVFSILRILVLVVLVRQIMLANYEGAFFCILTLLLLYVPSWIQVKLRIELPPPLEITIFCFIFAAEILGEVNAFYVVIPGWDTMLHTINGFLAAAVGFSMVMLLNDDDRITFHLSPAFLALVAFCFSMTIGVLWEFFEFGMDFFLGTDMQKDTVIHAIHSVSLDPTLSNKVVTIPDIQDVVINGESLGLGGYLDIGIIDTMKAVGEPRLPHLRADIKKDATALLSDDLHGVPSFSFQIWQIPGRDWPDDAIVLEIPPTGKSHKRRI